MKKILYICLLLVAMSVSLVQAAEARQRVIVTTDAEIDDECSLVRFLLYMNDFDVEGIISSGSQYHTHDHNWAGDDWYLPYMDAYAAVYPNLVQHDNRYPTPGQLRGLFYMGNVETMDEMEKVTPGSQRIVEVLLDKSDNCPVWIQAWGGTSTIARALKTIEENHPEEMEYVAKKLRFYFIWEQDNTYQSYIRPHWGKYNIPTIISDQFIAFFYHWKKYLPKDSQKYLCGKWMNKHILQDHGALCSMYKAHENGDFRSEGDSPAYFHVIPTGLRSYENPGWGGWGGRFVNVRENTWLDQVYEEAYEYPAGRWYTSNAWGRTRLKKEIPNDDMLVEYLKPMWRWTAALQNDFAARADWCVQPYDKANHQPVVVCNAENLVAAPGESLQLSAEGTYDPDGDKLTYRWWQYMEAGTCALMAEISDAKRPQTTVTIPAGAKEGESLHLVLEVSDKGKPSLTRYARVVIIVSKKEMAERVADAEMRRFPEAWQTDSASRPVFGYCQGLEVKAFFMLAEEMKRQGKMESHDVYLKYALDYMNTMVREDGSILNYDYVNGRRNLDMINGGKNLFDAYKLTGNEKYKKAIELLYSALRQHPRNSYGGFWHKENYPWQMWLDGVYMADPFLAQYGKEYNRPDCIDDAIHQCLLIRDFLRDEKTGLYYHAWDERKVQAWCDPATGLSHHFWGRSIGWWNMAVIDILDFVPENHPKRQELIAIVQDLAATMLSFRVDGCWYQLVNLPQKSPNYKEGTVTSMMLYCYTKALQKGYLDASVYGNVPQEIYDAIQTHLFRVDSDGTPNITGCCKVAGLGGNPYRDGSFRYYMSEPIRDNDPKAVGPFIMACIMLGK